ASFAGSSLYNSVTSSSASLDVNKHSTTLTLSAISSIKWGQTVSVSGTLTDDDNSNSAISGKSSTFSGTGACPLASAATTGSGFSQSGTDAHSAESLGLSVTAD